MRLRYFALVYGLAFLLVGIAGFVPGLLRHPHDMPDLAVHGPTGYLFGLFPVNVLHSLVHVAFGIWGLAAFASWAAARVYARSVAVIYGVLAVLGLIPFTNTTFGLVPIFGHDVWLHAVLAIGAAAFGWFVHERAGATTHTTAPAH